jgi:predicted cobalt transporter CbtA
MEYVAGATLVVIGLLVLAFGNTPAPRGEAAAARRSRALWWSYTLFTWAMGLLCIWFGAALALGRVRFG